MVSFNIVALGTLGNSPPTPSLSLSHNTNNNYNNHNSKELKRQLGIESKQDSSCVGLHYLYSILKKKGKIGVVLVIGYIGNLLPFMGVQR